MMFLLKRENARRDAGERKETILGEDSGTNDKIDGATNPNGTFSSSEEAKAEKGDLYSGFRYMI